jgi:hypothetical protein
MMRDSYLVLLFSACLLASDTSAKPPWDETRIILRTYGAHFDITWEVPKTRFENASRWNLKSEPGLSPAQAVAAARSYLRSHGGLDTLPIRYVELSVPMGGSPEEGLYFYHITFDHPSDEDNSYVDVVVLLDGFVVPPTEHKTAN